MHNYNYCLCILNTGVHVGVHVYLQVLSSSSTEIKCLTGVPPEGSPAIADNDMTYPDTERGYRFRGILHYFIALTVQTCYNDVHA